MLLVTLLLGCDQSQHLQSPARHVSYPPEGGGTLIDAMNGEPSGLITMIAGESAAASIASQIFNTLLRYDQNLDLIGDLASSWQLSPDQKVITFKLKSGVQWADGVPLTSQDVLFTWRLIIDEQTHTPYGADYKLVIRAEAPDPLTFRVHYAQAYAPALDSWAGLHILPQHILQGQDINTTSFARHPVGSSYYQLLSWKNSESITLGKNERSSILQARISRRISRIIPDPATQFLELMADHIDMVNLTPIQYARVLPTRRDMLDHIARYKELGNNYTYLGFNLKRFPFHDKRVRQAMNYAINKQELIDGVLLGLGTSVAAPYKPGTRWSDPTLKPYPYDPTRARQLLRTAGYQDLNGDGWLEDRTGKSFVFEVLTNQNKQREMTAILLQQRLKDVGIRMNIRVIEWASFISHFIKTGDFDAVLLGWSLGLDPDQYNIWHSSQQQPGQFNFIGYQNTEVDRLLEQGRLELNPDKRMAVYHRFSRIWLEDSPVVPLYTGYGLSAIHQRVRGILDPAPPAGIGYNQHDWYIPRVLRRNELMP